MDELPTLYLPNLAELPATARKYGMATIACIQSGAQLEKTYGAVGLREIQENLSNQFIGNCGVYSAKYGSTIFGREEFLVATTTTSKTFQERDERTNETIGKNVGMHERDRVKIQEFAGLEVGTFFGKVVESDAVFFQEQFKSVSSYDSHFKNENLQDIPDNRNVTKEDLIDNQRKIEADIELLLGKITPTN